MPAKCREPLCPFRALPLRVWRLPPHRKELPNHHRSYGLMGQAKTLPLTSVVPISAGLCRLSPVPAGRWSFPALSPQSLYRCLDPYPAASLWCTYSFLPKGLRPHLTVHRFGTPNDLRNATSTKERFRGCSHFIMFRLPYSLDPQVAPTAVARMPQGSRAVYTTQWTCGYPHELWHHYASEPSN